MSVLPHATRSEEHTSELQSRRDLVCRLLLEKKKKILDANDAVIAKHRPRYNVNLYLDELLPYFHTLYSNAKNRVLVEHNNFFFFFNDTATTEIYTLSLHDALPI